MEDTAGVVTLGMPCKFYIHRKNILNLDFGIFFTFNYNKLTVHYLKTWHS